MAIFAPTDPTPSYAPPQAQAPAPRIDTRHSVGNITARQRRLDEDAVRQVERAAREATYRTPALMLPGHGR